MKKDITELQVKQRAEGVIRMKMLNIIGRTVEEFRRSDLLNRSEGGILYWLNEDEKKYVAEFEKESGAKVYHVIMDYLKEGGHWYSMLYVSNKEENWSQERKELKNGEPRAYVYDDSAPWNSEDGLIGVKPQWGGVRRVS